MPGARTQIAPPASPGGTDDELLVQDAFISAWRRVPEFQV